MSMFCLKCKTHQPVRSSKVKKTKNNKFRLAAVCTVCGTKTSRFISVKTGGGLRDLVNKFNLKLPFELHMILQTDDGKIKRASFCGPGTKLDRRVKGLNRQTGTFDSIVTPPVNDLEAAWLKHDVAYAQFKDVPNRNIHDAILARNASEVAQNAGRIFQRSNARLVKSVMNFKVANRI